MPWERARWGAPESRFCSQCGAPLGATVPTETADLEGERRQASVVFSDLSGYTALNEILDPEEVEAVVSRLKAEAVTLGHADDL